MIRVGFARTEPSYCGVAPPYHPDEAYPEIRALLPPDPPLSRENPAYGGVRASLAALGLDAARFGATDWNPLGDLVPRGGRIVLKPNFIRHWNPNPRGTVDSVITHGAVLRAMVDYAIVAAGPDGTVEIAEASQQDCDFVRIREIAGIDAILNFHAKHNRLVRVIDLRRECVLFRDGIIVERRPLPGDPRGYRIVDLGRQSFFEGSGLDPRRFRGADYDSGPTADHHDEGRNQYLLSETVLSADLVVNLPKLKTHKKTGVTLALKNLVGINGDKNWLPHHTAGPPARGGDEVPGTSLAEIIRARAVDICRPLLHRGLWTGLFRAARRVETQLGGEALVRSGNWHGNRTTWRMCLDLNRCLYYSNSSGLHLDAPEPVRKVLTVLDGVVAGEGAGPLAPDDVPLGAILASVDPVALDLAAVRIMGFDARKIPKIWAALTDSGPRITAVRSPADVEIVAIEYRRFPGVSLGLDDLPCIQQFAPHAGWRGHVEGSPYEADPAERPNW